MKIERLPPIDFAARSVQYTDRSDTLHLSTIINDILFTLEPDRYGGPPNFANFMMGLVFERALEMAWLSKEMEVRPELIRPGEFQYGGITFTPDAYDTKTGCPEEYKFTKKSCRQPITDKKFWPYIVQVKAQVFGLRELGFAMGNTGNLHTCHVNGNYSRDKTDPESGYVINSWGLTFTDVELEENWENVLVNHARRKGWM